MKNIDVKFKEEQRELLLQCKNKKFIKYKADPFRFSNTVYNKLGLFIGNNTYQIRNEIERQDYFGDTEDVARFFFEEINKDDIKSGLENIEQIDTIVDSKIINIYLIQEKQTLIENNEKTYEVNLTRAIIFKTEDREYAFVKDIWFSEEIEIIRANDLVKKLSTEYEKENHEFQDGCILYTERYIEEL